MKLTEQRIDGQRWLCFHGNDYHRLTRHPKVVEAAVHCAQSVGLSVSASRRTTGNHPLYGELEELLATYLDLPAAVVLPSGYLANLAASTAFGDEVFLAKRHHPSLADALRGREYTLSEARGLPHSPNAWFAFDPIEANTGVVEDGLVESVNLVPNLLVDDCHGVGVVGAGLGFQRYLAAKPTNLMITGTFSKAFGCFGGFVAGNHAQIAVVKEKAGAFVGSTPFPLPIAAAAIQAIRLLIEEPFRYETIDVHRERLASEVRTMQDSGWKQPQMGAIISCPPGKLLDASILRQKLKSFGIFPPFVNYPGAPSGGHFRFTVSSEHTNEEVDRLLEALRDAYVASRSH